MTPHQPSGRTRLGLLLALATMLLWGLLPLALKVALASMDAYTITWYRFLVSTVVLGALLAYRRSLPPLARQTAIARCLLGVATVFLAANYISYLLGLHYTTPANAQVLIQLAPLLLALGGIGIFGERFTRVQWMGFAVLLVGLAGFFEDQLRSLVTDAGEYYRGSLLVLLAAATWAVYGLAQKQLLSWLPSQGIMVCIYAGCALLFTPTSSPRQILQMNGVELGMLLFCALNTVTAYGTFSEALVHWEASRVGAVLALAPLATIAAAATAHAYWPDVIPAVSISRLGMCGAGLVVVGSLISSLGQRRLERRAS
jgi:drug/metabolite transporter (DMT)-like permease